MSEFINNSEQKRKHLKELILKLHGGEDPERIKAEIRQAMGQVPYDDVVRVEQELIAGGLPQEEVVKLCDLHIAVLDGSIDQSGAQTAPAGHPVHTFKEENRALEREIAAFEELARKVKGGDCGPVQYLYHAAIQHFNRLMDVNKHYQRKENLVFPFLEKHGITGPPAVMRAKHDEARTLMKKALEVLASGLAGGSEIRWVLPELSAATRAITEMISREENILFPMCMDALTGEEWYEVYRQSPETGFCLFGPKTEWLPASGNWEEKAAHGRGVAGPDGEEKARG